MWQRKYWFLTILLIILFQNLNSQIPIRVYLKIYEVPAYQSILSAQKTENGGLKGTKIGGNVTATFPSGIVLLDSDLGRDASDSIVENYIKSKVLFGCPEIVNIFPVAKYELELNPLSESKRIKEELSDFKGNGLNYEIKIKPQFISDNEIILNLQFIKEIEKIKPFELLAFRKYKREFERKMILNQTFGFKFFKNYYIGFLDYSGKLKGMYTGFQYLLNNNPIFYPERIVPLYEGCEGKNCKDAGI
jgi:hypothetical protein